MNRAKHIARKLHVPKATEMLPQQIETLRWIAENHQQRVVLINGLIVHPGGELEVDHEKSEFYDAVIECEKLIKRIKAMR